MAEKVHLYVISHKWERSGFQGPVKIGISSNPRSRLQTLQTANPYPLGILWDFKLADRLEALHYEHDFHREFSDHRMCGEWFDIQPQSAIQHLCTLIRLGMSKEAGGKFALIEAGVVAAEIQFPVGKVKNLAVA